MAPLLTPAFALPSLAVDLPLDDAIAILKRRQVGYQSTPNLPPAKEPEKDLALSTASLATTATSSPRTLRLPRKLQASANWSASTTLSIPQIAVQHVKQQRAHIPKDPKDPKVQKAAKLPKLLAKPRTRESFGPLPQGWRPSSRGQTVSRQAAAAFWGITLEDDGDMGNEEDYSSSTQKHQKPQKDFPYAALHAATSVPLGDLKEACAVFERFAQSDSEDLLESTMDMRDFEKLLCNVCNVQHVSELAPEFVKSAFHTADRDHTGDIDIWEFVTWYSAFSFSEAVCVNKVARSTRNVARKHGMSILNIERYKRAFDRYDLNNNNVIEIHEFKSIIGDLLKIPPGLDLPNERVMQLWRNADKDGNGSIDFDEFVAFYVKVFGDTFETDFDPVTDYYRSMRRVQ
ncbi:unnamed protein product [Effrenium voratum]|nr:unnamed protein product [Effrenium voratum]